MISRREEKQKAQGESRHERPTKGVRNDFRKEVALGLHLNQCVASMGMGIPNGRKNGNKGLVVRKHEKKKARQTTTKLTAGSLVA